MKASFKKIIVGSTLSLALLSVPQASAFSLLPPQLIGIIADFLATSASYIEQAETAINTADQLQQQIKAVEQGAKNLESLSAGDIANWNKYIDELGGVMSQTNGLAYAMADMDTKFSENFPEYDDMVTKGKTGDKKQQAESFAEMYKTLTDRNRGTALGTLKNLKKTGDYLVDDEQTLNSLKLSSDNATGNLQVMQAANRIAVHQTQTLKNLHSTMLSQQNLMAQQLATENQRIAIQQAKAKAMRDKTVKPTKNDETPLKTW